MCSSTEGRCVVGRVSTCWECLHFIKVFIKSPSSLPISLFLTVWHVPVILQSLSRFDNKVVVSCCCCCLSSLLPGGSWLGCQDLPAMEVVFILELAANSESSWTSQAPFPASRCSFPGVCWQEKRDPLPWVENGYIEHAPQLSDRAFTWCSW